VTAPFEIVLKKSDDGRWCAEVEIRGVPEAYTRAKGVGTTGEAAEGYAKIDVFFNLMSLARTDALPAAVDTLLDGELAERDAKVARLNQLIDELGAGRPLPAPFEALFRRRIA
jgi:hypothetical protein